MHGLDRNKEDEEEIIPLDEMFNGNINNHQIKIVIRYPSMYYNLIFQASSDSKFF